MTTRNDPNRCSPSQTQVDHVFAELASSMPDVASTYAPIDGGSLEVVEIVVPHSGGKASVRLMLEVPTQIAPIVRAEFSPDRVVAMAQAINALVALSAPLRP